MKNLKTGATNGEIVVAINRLIDESNEAQDALEASLRAEYGLDGDCDCDECLSEAQESQCGDCGEGPCQATPECIAERSAYALVDALDSLRGMCEDGTAYDKQTAAKTILEFHVSLAELYLKSSD